MTTYKNQKFNTGRFHGQAVIASNIGPSHIKNDLPNQDYAGYAIDGQKLAFAVADGLGSCKSSHLGSKIAVETVLDLIKKDIDNFLEEEIKNLIWENWKSAVGENQNDFSTTLRFLIFTGKKILVGGIGDGVTLLKGENFSSYKSEDIFANCTYALCDTIDNFFVTSINIDVTEFRILIATDGIANEIRVDAEQELLDYMICLLPCDCCEQEIMEWLNSLNDNNGDDKTLLAAVVKCNL